jgi:hypothetical protein
LRADDADDADDVQRKTSAARDGHDEGLATMPI